MKFWEETVCCFAACYLYAVLVPKYLNLAGRSNIYFPASKRTRPAFEVYYSVKKIRKNRARVVAGVVLGIVVYVLRIGQMKCSILYFALLCVLLLFLLFLFLIF